jgi:hypothetical protein
MPTRLLYTQRPPRKQSPHVAASKSAQPPAEAPQRRPSQNAQRVASLQTRRTAELKRRRRMHLARIVHGLGERPVFEAFDRLANEFDESVVDHLLERFANIDPAVLRALGADKLPPLPVHIVEGRE